MYMYHIVFSHFSIVEHLGCFPVMAIINSAAMNFGVHVSFWIMFLFFFSGYMPSSQMVNFRKYSCIPSQNKWKQYLNLSLVSFDTFKCRKSSADFLFRWCDWRNAYCYNNNSLDANGTSKDFHCWWHFMNTKQPIKYWQHFLIFIYQISSKTEKKKKRKKRREETSK